jgi:hypothetical protein
VPLDEDLDTIDQSIRRLQIEWDKFFGGLEKKPPNDLKTKVEALLRRYANSEIRNNTDRFRYQSLSSKYTSLNELWAKRLRAKEEGKPFGVHGFKVDVLPPPPPAPLPAGRGAAGQAGKGRKEPSEVRIQSPERDTASVKALYGRFLAARREAGEITPVKFESFQKLIGQQTSRILSEKGGQAVEFRLETKGGKVSLKAKIVK